MENRTCYEVYWEDTAGMFGIAYGAELRAPRISTDREEVRRLADQCNRLELSPVHLADVVEDFRRG